MKVQVVLSKSRQTPGTVVYAVADPMSVVVGQVYARKDHLEKVDGRFPDQVTLTIEAGDTTGEQ